MGNYRQRVFGIGDTHFGHKKMVHGDMTERIRPFLSIEDHDEELVRRWNSVVDPRDLVYHLGDVVINRWALQACARLNGRKILVMGNHDIFRMEEYLQYFDQLRGAVNYSNMLLTHIPVHPSQMTRFDGNIHGHLHHRYVTDAAGELDIRYECISTERVNYTPVLLDEVVQRIRRRRGIE